MKYLVLFACLFLPASSFSQDAEDNFAVGIGSYFFQYQEQTGGSVAIGPSVYWRDGDVGLQLGLLLDLQKYEDYADNQGNLTVSTKRSFLVPVLGHYRFYKKEQLGLFATVGVIIGGKYYLDKDEITRVGDAFAFLLGAGASYRFGSNFYLRLCPNLRYSDTKFNPGAMVELLVSLGKKSSSEQ